MSKSVMIIDTPRDCCECPFGTIVFGKDVCLLDEGNGIECPLKPYKDFIPIEWIVKRINHYSDLILTYPNEKELLYSQTELISLLEDWEKENEAV